MTYGLHELPGFLATFVDQAARRLPYSLHGKRFQSVHRLRKLLTTARAPWPESFVSLRSPLALQELGQLLSPEVLALQSSPFARHLEHYECAKDWDLCQQMMYLDLKTYLPGTNLAYTDKTSMAHGLEVRVPYLDKELVELVARVPSRFKVRMRQSKVLLRSVSKGLLPAGVVNRRKSGFGLPLRDWFLNDLQPLARELLSESRLKSQGLFRPRTVSRWLKEHREKVADHSSRIYSLMTFQLWADRFSVLS